MTEVQKILKDLKNNNTTNQTVECFEAKKINDGYYKLWLTNGKYSYVTNDNFLKIEPYICYKEKSIKSPMEKLFETISAAIEEYRNDQKMLL